MDELTEGNPSKETIVRPGMRYGIVCMLDALGTKGVWNNQYNDEYIKNIKTIRETLRLEIDKLKEDKNINEIADFNHYIFSDTIILAFQSKDQISNDIRIDILFNKMAILISRFYSTTTQLGVFYRGALSCGSFFFEDNVIFGPAIDEVAEYYEIGNLFTVVCTPTASFKLKFILKMLSLRKINADTYFLEHDVPLKNAESVLSKKLFVVDWPKYINQTPFKSSPNKNPSDDFDMTEVLNKMGLKNYIYDFFSKHPIPQKAVDKYDNTVFFIELSERMNKKSK